MLHGLEVAGCAILIYFAASVPAAMLIGSMLRFGRVGRSADAGPHGAATADTAVAELASSARAA